MRAGLALVFVAAAVQLGWVGEASACTRPLPRVFTLDTPRALDRQPPSVPLDVQAEASRVTGTYCSGGVCTASTCGSEAFVQLEFQPAFDDRTPQPDLGYRLRFLTGSVPPELENALGTVLVGMSPLTLSLPEGFAAVVGLDATFELVALDRAGNESASSAPFRVAFAGCTRAFAVDGCIEDVGGSCNGGECVGPSESESRGCSLAGAAGGRSRSGPLAIGLALAGYAMLWRRRRRR